MKHTCGKCEREMDKAKAVLTVEKYHMRIKRRKTPTHDWVERERIHDGFVQRKRTCYICPCCRYKVFYGTLTTRGKDEEVD